MHGKALYRNQRQQDTLCTGMTEAADMFNLVAVLDELMSVRRRRTCRDAVSVAVIDSDCENVFAVVQHRLAA